jgi:diguanylate cyclase (GGDEF)-like protein/PAS domain S-box-containing protein
MPRILPEQQAHARPAMQAPPTPVDEPERLLALYRLGILDTEPTESLDRITRLAAAALRVPILLVSLVDLDRQWFKSCVGLDITETSREISFCGHVVFERVPLVVNDATGDPRFAANPLVTGMPHIRAYLGVPLFTLDQQPIGTLCAIDVKPRQFSDRDLETMLGFAKIAEDSLKAKEMAARTESTLQLVHDRERRFRETFDQAAVGIVHTALDGRPMRANRRFCEMLGYAEVELQRLTFVDITHVDDIPGNAMLFQRLLAGEIHRYRMQKRFIKKDGSLIWASLAVALARDLQGEPDYMIAVIDDISEMKQVEADLIGARDSLAREVGMQTAQLKERNKSLLTQVKKSLEFERAHRRSERRMRTIANAVPSMIGYWNHDLRCEFANESYKAWFGLEPDQVVGMTMRELMGETLFRSNEPYALMALEGHAQQFERTLKRADGSISFTEARYIPDMDESGEIRGFYAYVADITRLRAAHAELEALNAVLHRDSTTDYLTGIANRRVFSERSEEAARKCQTDGEGYGLILIDLDNFKRINDNYGHDVGDDVLRAVGRVLKEQLREREDIGARLGGEEFAVLCFGELDRESMIQLAERIRGQINRETIHTAKGPVSVTCSFGLALSQPDDGGWRNIYARADLALYEAKHAGKDRVVFGSSAQKSVLGRVQPGRTVPAD